MDSPYDTVPVRVAFPDWLSPLFSTFGMIIVNLIDKQRLLNEGGFSSSDSVAWKARLFLFLGFALMAGGLAGSITTLLLKYVLPAYEQEWMFVRWWGVANVLQSSATMLRWALLNKAWHLSEPLSFYITAQSFYGWRRVRNRTMNTTCEELPRCFIARLTTNPFQNSVV